MTGYIEGTP